MGYSNDCSLSHVGVCDSLVESADDAWANGFLGLFRLRHPERGNSICRCDDNSLCMKPFDDREHLQSVVITRRRSKDVELSGNMSLRTLL